MSTMRRATFLALRFDRQPCSADLAQFFCGSTQTLVPPATPNRPAGAGGRLSHGKIGANGFGGPNFNAELAGLLLN